MQWHTLAVMLMVYDAALRHVDLQGLDQSQLTNMSPKHFPIQVFWQCADDEGAAEPAQDRSKLEEALVEPEAEHEAAADHAPRKRQRRGEPA